MLGFEITIPIRGPMNSLYTPRGLFWLLEGDVDSQRLGLTIRALPIADRNLLDISVLAKKLGFTQRLEQFVFPNRGRQPRDVDEVLLDDAHSDEVPAVLLFRLALLSLFLALLLGTSFLVLLDVCAELGDSATVSARCRV